MKTLVSVFLLPAVLFLSSSPAAQQPPPRVAPPKLVVLLVADQLRADYEEWYGRQWTGGLHELLTNGAVFPLAKFPYAATKTCAGHATIGTGRLPSSHGMIDNEWYDPARRQFVACTEDPNARSIAFGGLTGSERHSAARLIGPTFVEELRRHTGNQTQVLGMSLKARSSIMLVGHGAANTTVLWEEDAGTWATSSAFSTRASAEVDAYIRAHPVDDSVGRWDRAMPASAYQFADLAPGEPALDEVFPHLFEPPIRVKRGTPGFLNLWDLTPLTDAYLGAMANALTDKMRLGRGAATDVLAISFSGLDFVGHRFGPRSHEVQDTLYRLDRIIGNLLALLDRTVGRGNYTVAFTADHGVALLPEQVTPAGSARRLNLGVLGEAVEDVLSAAFGPARYVDAIASGSLYFAPGVLPRIKGRPEVMTAIETAARAVPGVARVFWSWDLAARTPTSDPMLQSFRSSYAAGRSGDLAYALVPDWITIAAGANHGSPYDYDTRVPLVFYGAGIKAGTYPVTASPADIAPTLAALTGVTMGDVDGVVRREALGR